MRKLLSTRETAQVLGVNEKMIYSLISDKGLPATKVTGKWLCPSDLVQQWVDNNTVNYPERREPLPPFHGLLVVAGSNDILFDRALSLFMRRHEDCVATFANAGSLGGLRAMRRGLCHFATSHLMQDDGDDYNFEHARRELENMPAVVNFCRREQGILTAAGNPEGIRSVADFAGKGVRIVNRPVGTGTRLLLDKALDEAGAKTTDVEGYETVAAGHLDAGLAILSGRADACLAIRPVAELLGLGFQPLHRERFDLIIPKDRFFDKPVQQFLTLLADAEFRQIAEQLPGYDLSLTGQMVFPQGVEPSSDIPA